jgi:HPt (histidine-containing phosphotransfer) domain-containing protein
MVRGNAAKYARLLTLFAESHANDAHLIEAALAANDLRTLKEMAHTLKGSAGNVGAIRVAEPAAALHYALHSNAAADNVDTCCAALSTELRALVERILGVMKPSPAPGL